MNVNKKTNPITKIFNTYENNMLKNNTYNKTEQEKIDNIGFLYKSILLITGLLPIILLPGAIMNTFAKGSDITLTLLTALTLITLTIANITITQKTNKKINTKNKIKYTPTITIFTISTIYFLSLITYPINNIFTNTYTIPIFTIIIPLITITVLTIAEKTKTQQYTKNNILQEPTTITQSKTTTYKGLFT